MPASYNYKMKTFTEQQVADIIKLKFGKQVTSANNPSYASNAALGKAFGVSASKIRQLYLTHFEAIRLKQAPLLERLQQAQRETPR